MTEGAPTRPRGRSSRRRGRCPRPLVLVSPTRRRARAAAQPAPRAVRLAARSRAPGSPAISDPGPEQASTDASLGALPRDVRDRDLAKSPRTIHSAGAAPTLSSRRSSLSTIPTSCSSSAEPNGGSPRQREDRQIGDEERHDATRGQRRVSHAARSSITSPQTARSPIGKQRTDSCASIQSGSSGRGTSSSVREGWRSAIPSTSLSAATFHFGGTHAMWVITDVRRFGCDPSADDASRNRASSRSSWAIETSSPVQLV